MSLVKSTQNIVTVFSLVLFLTTFGNSFAQLSKKKGLKLRRKTAMKTNS